MKKHYFLVLFSLYSIISFGQFDVSEMGVIDNSSNTNYSFTKFLNPGDLTFNNTGTRVFLLASNPSKSINSVLQFDLNNPYDISSIDESSEVEYNTGYYILSLEFNSSGTELFLFDPSEYEIKKYNLSSAFDLNNTTYAGDFEKSSLGGEAFGDFTFNNNGTKMYTIYDQKIKEYNLLTPYDVSSANYLGNSEDFSLDISGDGFYIEFNSIGDKLFIHYPNFHVAEYSLTTPFDVSTANFSGSNEKFTILNTGYTSGFSLSSAGEYLFLTDSSDQKVVKYILSTPFDVSTATSSSNVNSQKLDTSSQESTPTGLTFNNDGTKLFTVGSDDDYVTEYSLNTAFDMSSATYSGASEEFLVNSQEPTPQDVQFNNDGTKMFIIGSSGDAVFEYNLGTAFDVSTANYAGDVEKKSVNSEEKFPTGFSFNNDGTKMFVVGHQAQAVLEYSLVTAYDVSTASYAGDIEKLPVSSQDITPEGILFNTDGTKMFVLGSTNDAVFEYTLSTSFDVSTASYSGNSEKLDCSSEDNSPSAIASSKSGNQLFMIGTENATIFTYSNGNEETLSFDFSEKKITTTVYLENGQFKNDVESQIYVFNIVGQQIPNNNLKSGIYIIILRFTDGTIQSFKRAI